MISLAQLQHCLGAELVPAPGFAVPLRQVSGVHISELEDPTPYLEGGELLLTTGIPVTGALSASGRVRSYVDRLVERGVSALGLGLGAGLDAVPSGLIEACRSARLALLLVPAGVPFLNVSRAYWDLVSRAGQSDLVASLGTQTALARAALRPDANASVIKALAQALGGWAAYLPAAGSTGGGAVPGENAETFWPEGARGLLAQLREQTARLNLGALHSAATFQIHGSDVVEHPVLVDRRIVGFLAVGTGRTLGKADRQVIQTVCMLLSLKARQEQETHAAGAAMGSAVAKLLLGGHAEAARILAEDFEVPLPEGPVRLLLVTANGPRDPARNPGEEAADVVSRLRGVSAVPWLPAALRACRLRHPAGAAEFFILDAVPGTTSTAGATEPATSGPPSSERAVLSETVPLARLTEARGALLDALLSQAPGTLGVPGRRDPSDVNVEEWIEALRKHPRADLPGTVRSYLKHRGQWEAAARELGIHRNSLRHRIATAARIIGAELDDPDVAARLWLGLRRERTSALS